MKKLADLLDGIVVEPTPTVPPHLALDRGYDCDACRDEARARGYTPHIPPKATKTTPLPPPGHPDRHPPRRWVVEVAHSWFNRFRRLLTRTEKQARHYLGFSHIAAILIIYRKIRHARLLSG
jgi:transposase